MPVPDGFEPSTLFDVQALLDAPLPLLEAGRKAAAGGFYVEGSHAIGEIWVGDFESQRVALADYAITETVYGSRGPPRAYVDGYAFAAVEVPADVPLLSLEREGLFSRAADRLGMEDVEVGYEAFDREFQIEARDEQRARELLDVVLMDRLRALPKDVSAALGGSFVIAWKRGSVDADPCEPIVEAAAAIASRIPATPVEPW